MDRHDNHQRGSVSAVVMASILALSSVFAVIYRVTQQNSHSIAKARTENFNQDRNRSFINGVSISKALLSPKRQGSTEPIPAVFAENYYDPVWNITSAQAKNDGFKLLNARTFAVSLPYLLTPGSKELASIMQGSQSFFANNANIEIDFYSLKTNFDSNGRQALSIDLQAKSKGKSIVTARIPLAAVAPRDVKVEYSKPGENDWHSLPSSLDGGKYDFRVLASGIAFDGVAYLNGTKIAEFGGFDDSGKIRHKAVSYKAIDEVVGSFTYDLAGGDETFLPDECKVTSVGENYALSVVVNSPAGTKETQQSVSVNFQTGSSPSEALSYGEFMSSCMDQCPYASYEGESVMDRSKYKVRDLDEMIAVQYFGDFTSARNRDDIRFEINALDVRLCSDFKPVAEEFKRLYGHYYTSEDELYDSPARLEILKLQNWISYSVPACERKFLFTRTDCGCFDSSTKIRLGNNQDEKAISELTSEDTVWNPILKRAFRIRKMVQGGEKIPMVRISTVERSINVTRNHPMVTPRGVIAAFKVTDNDQIMIDGDSWSQVVKVSEIPFEGEEPIVWNLELESTGEDDDSHFVLANGIITGDLFIQNKIEAELK